LCDQRVDERVALAGGARFRAVPVGGLLRLKQCTAARIFAHGRTVP
jgi:hypothetical protein